MGYSGSVIMVSPSRHFHMDFAKVSGSREPSFHPKALNYTFARFSSCSWGYLGLNGNFFDFAGYGGEDFVDGCLELFFLALYFEFYVAHSHFDFYWGFLFVLFHSYTLLNIVLHMLFMRNI